MEACFCSGEEGGEIPLAFHIVTDLLIHELIEMLFLILNNLEVLL